MKAQIEDVAGILLVDEHIAPVVDAESAEDDAQLLDTFGRAQLARSGFEARVEREVSLPHLAALERARLQFERRLQVTGLLLETVRIGEVRIDFVGSSQPMRSRFDVRHLVLVPNVVIGFRLQQLVAKSGVV